MDYERGLQALSDRAKHLSWYSDALLYEARLRTNMRAENLYGPTPQTDHDIARVVDQLNRLCLQHLQVSFNDLCLNGTAGASGTPLPSSTLQRPLGDVVCFYVRQDAAFYQELKTSLALWERHKKLNWLEMRAGDNISVTSRAHLSQANLILLLCSASFFDDSFCYDAMNAAIEEHARRQVQVVPILIGDCDWEGSPCAFLNVLPENRRPINQWTHRDQAYKSIRQSLGKLFS